MDGSKTTTRADKVLDLGTEGCSHLLENIADALKDLQSGQTLLVIANDPAAPLDIKVWSRQTGKYFVECQPDRRSIPHPKKVALTVPYNRIIPLM